MTGPVAKYGLGRQRAAVYLAEEDVVLGKTVRVCHLLNAVLHWLLGHRLQ